MAGKSEQFLNCSLDWTALTDGPLLGHRLEPFQPLLTRIDPAQVEALLASSASEAQASQA
jgi:methionyl-tRNA synthetase